MNLGCLRKILWKIPLIKEYLLSRKVQKINRKKGGMEQVTISPETIMELMAEKGIMPEDVYQGLISQEDCQKHKKILSATTILVMKILKNGNIKMDLETILTLSATYYLVLVKILTD